MSMSDESKEALVIATAVFLSIAAVVTFFVILCVRVSANDARKIHRDQVVKLHCIDAGKSWVSGNCIDLGSR